MRLEEIVTDDPAPERPRVTIMPDAESGAFDGHADNQTAVDSRVTEERALETLSDLGSGDDSEGPENFAGYQNTNESRAAAALPVGGAALSDAGVRISLSNGAPDSSRAILTAQPVDAAIKESPDAATNASDDARAVVHASGEEQVSQDTIAEIDAASAHDQRVIPPGGQSRRTVRAVEIAGYAAETSEAITSAIDNEDATDTEAADSQSGEKAQKAALAYRQALAKVIAQSRRRDTDGTNGGNRDGGDIPPRGPERPFEAGDEDPKYLINMPRLVDLMSRKLPRESVQAIHDRARKTVDLEPFAASDRQLEILRLLAEDNNHAQAAMKLEIGHRTVESDLHALAMDIGAGIRASNPQMVYVVNLHGLRAAPHARGENPKLGQATQVGLFQAAVGFNRGEAAQNIQTRFNNPTIDTIGSQHRIINERLGGVRFIYGAIGQAFGSGLYESLPESHRATVPRLINGKLRISSAQSLIAPEHPRHRSIDSNIPAIVTHMKGLRPDHGDFLLLSNSLTADDLTRSNQNLQMIEERRDPLKPATDGPQRVRYGRIITPSKDQIGVMSLPFNLPVEPSPANLANIAAIYADIRDGKGVVGVPNGLAAMPIGFYRTYAYDAFGKRSDQISILFGMRRNGEAAGISGQQAVSE